MAQGEWTDGYAAPRSQFYGIKFQVPRGSDGQDWPTKVAERIFSRYLLDWIGLFLQKNASYGEGAYHVDGLAGYWPELRRKVARLRRAIWQGEDTSDWTEQPAEIIFDLIGTLFMCYDLLAEQVGPPMEKDMQVPHDFLSPGEQTVKAATELLDRLIDARPASKGPDGMTSLGKGEVFVGSPAGTAAPDEPLSALTFDGPLPARASRLLYGSLPTQTGSPQVGSEGTDIGAEDYAGYVDSDEPGDGGWCELPDSVKAVLQDINSNLTRGQKQPVSLAQAAVLADYYSEHGERL